MTDNTSDQVSMALVEPRKGFNPIWLLPLIVLLIGSWLGYKSLMEADIPIEVHFVSGSGIVEGKTEVQFQGIPVGTVKSLTLANDMQGVIAHITMDRHSQELLRENTSFWLVKPQVEVAGIRGLDTLLSGNYIAIRPGDGELAEQFEALKSPPPNDTNLDGLVLTLKAKGLGSLNIGSPVHYRDLRVGQIVSYRLNDDQDGMDIKVQIEPEFTHLVNTHTRFWNSSGFEFRGGVSGFKVSVKSLASLAIGGVSFGNPTQQPDGTSASNGDTYTLYADHEAAETGFTVLLHMPSAEGLQEGITEVRYRGLTAGRLQQLRINDDLDGVVATLVFDPRVQAIINDTTRFWLVQPEISLSKISGIGTLISGSYIEFDFQPSDQTQTEFTLLERPPTLDRSAPGLSLTLEARDLAGINPGSSVHYLQVPIGTVQHVSLNENGDGLLVDIHITPDYTHLVTPKSRFYNSSGVRINGNLSGLSLETDSLATILRGGISILNPPHSKPVNVKDGTRFTLYSSLAEATERGPLINIRFANSDGLRKGAAVRYQGVDVGKVTAVNLARDLKGVNVQVRLSPGAEAMAKTGARFWVARPQFGLTRVENLDTVITGVYIQALPGEGKQQASFDGLRYPPADMPGIDELQITVQARQLGSLEVGSPVLYREVPVGYISGYEISRDARRVDIHLNILPRYAPLIRQNSVFWNESGMHMDTGWFSGIDLDVGTMETLLAGGIGFATPETQPLAPPVDETAVFSLHDEAEDVWLRWQPIIDLGSPEKTD